ncbi:MAG: type II toxin-antitoxin system RelE/ParE family toxin [Fimbriiglobus sp.]
MNLDVHSEAREELDAAVEFLDDRGPALGDDLMSAWHAGLEAVAADPRRYAIADDSPDGADVRCYTITRFHYRLLYLVEGHTLTVLAFAHARRRPGYWADRLP